MLAAKASLAARVDALGEDSSVELGMETRAKVESRVRALEEGQVKSYSNWMSEDGRGWERSVHMNQGVGTLEY